MWSLQKVGLKDVKNWNAWLVAEGNLDKGARVGIDPEVIDYGASSPLVRVPSIVLLPRHRQRDPY